MNSKNHMVLLGGGRIAPNIASVWSLKPDEVHYLVSKDQPHTYHQMRAVLDHMDWLKADDQAILVDANDIPAVMECVKGLVSKIASESSDATITFNLTCSSKTMSVAVYETVKDAHPVIYIDSFTNRIIHWLPPYQTESLVPCNLQMYLANFGRETRGQYNFDRLLIAKQAAIDLATGFVNGGEIADHLLLKMRQLGWKDDRPDRCFRNKLMAQEIEVLQTMAAGGLIVDLGQSARGFWKYTIPHAMHWNFIKGDWLEVYVYSRAGSLQKKDNSPFFDEIAMSVQISASSGRFGQREIDFVGLKGWQLVWCSCKVEADPFDKRYLDEVGNINAMLGGQYATPIFISNGYQTDKNFEKVSQQASNARIVLVTREQFPEIDSILRKEATQPTYPRA